MKIFEGKTPNERNKIIAAAVLGVLSIGSLAFAFGPGLFSGSSTTATVKVTPSPKSPDVIKPVDTSSLALPSQSEQDFIGMTTPVVYDPSVLGGPDPGRNIFAFYEPPPPTPFVPTPYPTPPPPTPTPTPPYILAFVNPQSVYAGAKGFRLEATGQMFTPEAKLHFDQRELPTTFVSEQRLVADVPASLIAAPGTRQVIVQSPDGTKYSIAASINVQPPPKPEFQYIGMIARKRYNNDTAYFQVQANRGAPEQAPISARLNDVVAGRFRLVSISAEETIFEDVNLGFRHKVQLYRPPPGTAAVGGPPVRGFQGRENYVPFNPGNPGQPIQLPQQVMPGMPGGVPGNVPRVAPGNTNTQPPRRPNRQRDDDDDDDKDDGDGDGGQ